MNCWLEHTQTALDTQSKCRAQSSMHYVYLFWNILVYTGSDPIGKLKQSKFSKTKAETPLVGPHGFSTRREMECNTARGRGQASHFCSDGDHEVKKGGCTPVLLLLVFFYCPAAVRLHLWHFRT